MRYRVEIDNPLFGNDEQPGTLNDGHLEFFTLSREGNLGFLNFGLLRAKSPEDGSFLGGIALQHTYEFLPHGMEARGFVVDANLDLVEPPVRQRWTIFQELSE